MWKLPEDDLLRVALHATRAGVLTLSWDTVCPHCRGVRDENASLASLPATVALRGVRGHVRDRQARDRRGHVPRPPSIRDVPDQLYCSAEPAKKEHIRVQCTAAAGRSRAGHRAARARALHRVEAATPAAGTSTSTDHGATRGDVGGAAGGRRRDRQARRDARAAQRSRPSRETFTIERGEVERPRAARRAAARLPGVPRSVLRGVHRRRRPARRRRADAAVHRRRRLDRVLRDARRSRRRSSRSRSTSTRCSRSSPRIAVRSSRRSATP